jgi:hypothetical protein
MPLGAQRDDKIVARRRGDTRQKRASPQTNQHTLALLNIHEIPGILVELQF